MPTKREIKIAEIAVNISAKANMILYEEANKHCDSDLDKIEVVTIAAMQTVSRVLSGLVYSGTHHEEYVKALLKQLRANTLELCAVARNNRKQMMN